MPQAPDLVPTAQPSGFAPSVSVNTPPEAFGVGVAHALSGLGVGLEQAGDKIWQRAMDLQGIQNETEANNAKTEFMTKSGMMHADFINKEGVNAGPEALAKHIQELQDLRSDIRDKLSNPAVQRQYDAESLGFMGRNIFNAAGHSGQQVKVASNNAAAAQKDIATSQTGNIPEDDRNFISAVKTIKDTNLRLAQNGGWTPEQLSATNQKDISTLVGKRILGLADNKSAIAAQRMFDAAQERHLMTDVTADKVQKSVINKFNDQGSRAISDKVLANRRNGDEENRPVQEYIDEGLAEAEKYAYKDPSFPDYVRSRIIADYNRQHAIETDTDNMNTRVVGQAMLKANDEGYLPTSPEELFAIDPKAKAAWDELARNPQKKQAMMKQFEHNALVGTRVPVTPENLQQFHTWRGQGMNGTDEEKAAFMAHNFATESKMTTTQRNQLMSQQENMQRSAGIQADKDPRLHRALQYLGPDMEAAGITQKGGGSAREDYFSFVSQVQDQLDQYQKDHPGKLPTHEELRVMGAQLMQEQHTHWWQSSQKFYQTPVPSDEAEKLRKDPWWAAHGVTPNEGMIARIYRNHLFQKRYGGSAKTTEPAKVQFPPNAPMSQ